MVLTARDCLRGCARIEHCRSTPAQGARYLALVPQWLLDCADLFFSEVTVDEPHSSLPSLHTLRDTVAQARDRASSRWGVAPEPGAEISYAHVVADFPYTRVREPDDEIRAGKDFGP